MGVMTLEAIAEMIRRAIEEEREACAKDAESQAPDYPPDTTDEYRRGQMRGARDAATMIRRRSGRILKH